MTAWTAEEDTLLKSLYLSITRRDFPRLFPARSEYAVYERAKKLNLTQRKRREVNLGFFSELNPLSCYWAGFLAADGGIAPSINSVRLELGNKDLNHLKKFRTDVGSDNKIGKSRGCNYVSICSYEWIGDLKENFNITPKKSLTLKPPPLTDQEFIWSYIVGYLDGDGSIFKLRGMLTFSFNGTFEVLSWIKGNFEREFPRFSNNPTHRADVNPEQSFYRYASSGAWALEILQHLKKMPVPHLERKWNKVPS